MESVAPQQPERASLKLNNLSQQSQVNYSSIIHVILKKDIFFNGTMNRHRLVHTSVRSWAWLFVSVPRPTASVLHRSLMFMHVPSFKSSFPPFLCSSMQLMTENSISLYLEVTCGRQWDPSDQCLYIEWTISLTLTDPPAHHQLSSINTYSIKRTEKIKHWR